MHGANVPTWLMEQIIEAYPGLFGSKDAWKGFAIGYQSARVTMFEHIDEDEFDAEEGS